MSDLRILLVEDSAADAERWLRAGADGYEQKGRLAPGELRQILTRAIERER